MAVPPRSRGSALVRARTSPAARRVLLPAQAFFHTETTGGLLLLAAAVAALLWANSPFAGSYERLWATDISFRAGTFAISHTLREWINDALMVIFFFVVGLEIKRELVHGELSGWRRASLPMLCAAGGMIVPAGLYAALNAGTPGAPGWGIPMATDIAFALGVLALLGDRVPTSARIFLLALATVDDIGAILVIAIFYTAKLSVLWLLAAALLGVVLFVMIQAGVRNLLHYLPLAFLFWFAVLESGVHATIAGVVLGLMTPARATLSHGAFTKHAESLVGDFRVAVAKREDDAAEAVLGKLEELTVETEAPAERLVRLIHPWSSYVVLPVFALANAGVVLSQEAVVAAFRSPVARGVILGLLAGKVVGITAFAWLAVRARIGRLPEGLGWAQVAGLAVVAGIGFTVSLFITELAFEPAGLVAQAKTGVLAASLAAGIAGYITLRYAAPAAE